MFYVSIYNWTWIQVLNLSDINGTACMLRIEWMLELPVGITAQCGFAKLILIFLISIIFI